MALAVEGDLFYRRPSLASIARPTRTHSYVTPAILPARKTVLPNRRTESARRSPTADTTNKLDKLTLRPTIVATPKSSLVDVLRQNKADEMFSRVIQFLPKSITDDISNSGSFKKLIKCIISPDCPDTDHRKGTELPMNEFVNCRVFEGISKQEYEAIAYLVRERGFFPKKPKLTYNPCDSILIIEMPRSIHEWPLTDFRESVSFVLVHRLPWDDDTIRVSVETNHSLESLTDGYSANPDLTVQLTPYSDSEPPQVPVLLECAFTQDRDILWKKLKNAIDVYPEAVLVVAILVTETPDYRKPKEKSTAWTEFDGDEECRNSTSFLALKKRFAGGSDSSEPQSIRVDVADHVWCNITSSEFLVWVKKDGDEKIVIDHEPTARGSIFPSIEMEQVTTAINKGFGMVRDLIVLLTRKLDPTAETEELENADVSFPVKWKVIQRGLVRAAGLTAHERYKTWFNNRYCGQKRLCSDEEDYVDSGSNVNGSESASSHRPHTPPPRRITRSITRTRKAAKLR